VTEVKVRRGESVDKALRRLKKKLDKEGVMREIRYHLAAPGRAAGTHVPPMRRDSPMEFALSTRWNAFRHTDGEAMIEEILRLSLDRVELGCDLRMDLVPGVLAAVRRKAVRVGSLHNFCPLPVGAPRPDPELFLPASPDARERESAVRHQQRAAQDVCRRRRRHRGL